MKTPTSFAASRILATPLLASLFALACATATPSELKNARLAYNRASAGPAAQLTPTDLHKAKGALDKAEQNFAEGNDLQRTIDSAYVAERSAQIAEARAETATAEKSSAQAKQEYGTKQEEIAKATQGTLAKTREQLSESERGRAQQTQQAAASEQKAAAAELRAKESNEALAKLAAKEEARGMVITLSGSVLFRSNDSTLLPGAQTRLDQVAEALVAKGRDVVVEGYTDSKGSQSTNMNLSQRRAESVRTHLISKGFPGEKISARGMGPEKPIAENTSAEGRANNRRVEIVILKSPAAAAAP